MALRSSERAALLAAACSGVAAWAGFALVPPMQVRVGRELIDAWVPPHYQAAAFPAFGALLLLVWRGRRDRGPLWLGRVVILGACSSVAVVRLLGAHPLSGHAVFLAAVAAHEAFGRERSPVLLGSAALGLSVTAAYKALWGDTFWGAMSVGAGAAIGAISRLVFRKV